MGTRANFARARGRKASLFLYARRGQANCMNARKLPERATARRAEFLRIEQPAARLLARGGLLFYPYILTFYL